MKNVSIIVPLFNEEENVTDLHKEIIDMCRKNMYNFELIFVDDGSTDNTTEIVKCLEYAKLIRFRRNFGQTAAMSAGIKEAKHGYIITMDGDGQNDPADIPSMINYMEENDLDIVSGWRKKRKDSYFKKIISRGANTLRKILVKDNIHDSGCSLKVYKKDCFKNIELYGEMHRFIPAILKMKGYKVGEIVVNHRPRTRGKTKYNWRRIIKGFLDMVSLAFWNSFAVRPLHLLGGIGLSTLFLGFCCFLITLYQITIKQDLSNTVWPLLTAFLFLSGMQTLLFGFMADMISKTYYKSSGDSHYEIAEIHETEAEAYVNSDNTLNSIKRSLVGSL